MVSGLHSYVTNIQSCDEIGLAAQHGWPILRYFLFCWLPPGCFLGRGFYDLVYGLFLEILPMAFFSKSDLVLQWRQIGLMLSLH